MTETPRQLAERFVKEELQFLVDRAIIDEWLWERYGLEEVPEDLVDSVTEIAERVVKALSYSL